ncbi:MAG TPA: hypothetical protein DCL21_01860 [Alphaproteobacteria bacterium]|nr:hypothetical protein [Alphaproteobacteria bacterium]
MNSLVGAGTVAKIIKKESKWYWQIIKKHGCCEECSVLEESNLGSISYQQEHDSLQPKWGYLSSKYPDLEFEDTTDVCL